MINAHPALPAAVHDDEAVSGGGEDSSAVDTKLQRLYGTQEGATSYDEASCETECNIFCMQFTLWNKLLPPDVVATKTFLVLPCGAGRNVLPLKDRSAAHIVAADVSAAMVDCCSAKVTETASQSSQAVSSGIEYMVVDACSPSWTITQVDVALVIHLFCYAASFSELQAMCKTLSRNMKRGAQMISYSCAALPRTPSTVDNFCRICGVADMQYLHGSVDPPTPDISEYLWAGMRLKTQNWPLDVIQKALAEAGFGDFEWNPCVVDSAYTGELDLQRFTEVTNYCFLTATKLA
jgi:hypothetical protein